jgi:hypothetical protein
MKAIVGLLKSSTHIHNTYLVGGIFTPLKNMKVSWEGFSHRLWKNKKKFETTNQYMFSE